MKNWFTKLLAGLLAVMMLMSTSVAFMEEMPGGQEAIVEESATAVDVEEHTKPTEDAAEPDMGDASESASDDAAEPAPDHATEPASDDAQEPDADAFVPDENIEEADAVISSEPVDAIVEESEDTDLSMLDAQGIDDELDLDALEDDITDDDGSAMLMEPMGGAINLNNSDVISDARFRAYLAYTYDTDHNGVLSETEIANVTYISDDDPWNMDEDYYQAHTKNPALCRFIATDS